jgi:hypothetical protein
MGLPRIRWVGKPNSWPDGWCSCLAVLIFIVVAAIFVGRHEAQLAAEAEQALPGPLQLR